MMDRTDASRSSSMARDRMVKEVALARAESRKSFASGLKQTHVVAAVVVAIAVEAVLFALEVNLQWHWLVLYAALLVPLSPVAKDAYTFYRGNLSDSDTSATSFALLTTSSFISWIFAKSVQNASTLGAKFGILGGVAYAAWYTSFLSSAYVCYRLRKKFKVHSLAQAVVQRYGHYAYLSYVAITLYRLFNEVWSNSLVVATFYSDNPHDQDWWLAVVLSVSIPMIYVSLGGLRSSLVSDAIQAILALVLLVVVIGIIVPKARSNLATWNPEPGREVFSLEGGIDLVLVGLMQGLLSYPFFDPVLTDRTFLASPKTMLKSFVVGGTLAAGFIVMFSFIGIYGNMEAAYLAYTETDVEVGGVSIAGLRKGLPSHVSRYISRTCFTLVNIVMLTSSISTLDSTFSSVSKLVGPELMGFLRTTRPGTTNDATSRDIVAGRFAIVALAVAGVLPLISNLDALSATTISGTVAMGLGPPMIFLEHCKGLRPTAFHLSFWLGVLLGTFYQLSNEYPGDFRLNDLHLGEGSYRKLLGVNLLGACSCCAAFWIGNVVDARIFGNKEVLDRATDVPGTKYRSSPSSSSP